ncbi:MAG: hypothetical protein OXR66_02110 [Candidatus Woesearchaeota archaeon]|nr:hypothetical protein [Candidatus Woesearchaeota archaeon]
MKRWLEWYDVRIARFMREHALKLLRYSVAIIFIWFGFLKVIGFSPATELVKKTVYVVDPAWFVPLLGVWEVAIGLCFLYRPLIRVAIALLAPQMMGTFLPLFILPGVVFQSGNPWLLTMEGQYIVKNLLIISAAMVVGSTVRRKKSRL